ncbi:MAG TPA: LLM class flavin-dependent oxidoreductase [Amnibacterium sp.]|jgi:alkanesulfonate monooxygenase SsuD/methylene tetrahydromethanopterin reductase-like flavin-dependent oxidoreductase (luciferase family)|uniref:LLM class flavin-dependent oxidoreductase n=1 Tax=Amnibacterium sp. TaxID=1872496 RepID=UPI002F930306
MTTLGAVFLPQFAPERLRDVARAADEAGLEELWLWEDCFKSSGVAPMTAALAFTERLRVGVGLMPVPMRNVATLAMEAAVLERLFPGRSIIGVGHGVLEWMGWIGARVASPLTLLGEYLDALRPLLAGERLTVDGRYVKLTDVGLDWPPQQRVPVLAGAEGPKTLELVGAKADGVILTGGTTPDQAREALTRIEAARSAAGRTDPFRVVCFMLAATGPGAEERFEAERRAWEFPDGSDVGAAGDAETIAAAVRRWADAGVDTVVIQPTSTEPDPEGFFRFLGRQVRPLVA